MTTPRKSSRDFIRSIVAVGQLLALVSLLSFIIVSGAASVAAGLVAIVLAIGLALAVAR